MKFENKGKWLKEAEEKDNLVFDERTKVDFNEEEEIDGELAAEVESDEFIDELDRPEEEEDAIVMADESSQKNEADPNAERTLIAKKKEIQKLASKMGDDNLVQYLSLLKKYVDDAYNFAVKHFSESSQKNEEGIARIRKLGPKSVWKGPMYKENEYMVALYNNDMDFRRGISFFSNPKNKTLSKQDAISYVKEKWPGYKIVIEESSQINESRNYHVGVKISVPDNMNNKDVENRLEEILDSKGFTVLDITATRT